MKYDVLLPIFTKDGKDDKGVVCYRPRWLKVGEVSGPVKHALQKAKLLPIVGPPVLGPATQTRVNDLISDIKENLSVEARIALAISRRPQGRPSSRVGAGG